MVPKDAEIANGADLSPHQVDADPHQLVPSHWLCRGLGQGHLLSLPSVRGSLMEDLMPPDFLHDVDHDFCRPRAGFNVPLAATAAYKSMLPY